MAYRDSVGDNAQLLKRTLTRVTDFSGRSRRTEVIYYWIACALIGIVFNFAVIATLSFEASLLVGLVLELVLLIPMFALFTRRLHDQNRSGWWGLLLPAYLLLQIPQIVLELRGNIAAMVAQKTTPTGIVAGLLGMAILVLCLLPGTAESNRYGPDPRLEEF